MGHTKVWGCSCDRDLALDVGRGGETAALLRQAYDGNGTRPCLADRTLCKRWGWVEGPNWWEHGSWGIVGSFACYTWRVDDKYEGKLTKWRYTRTPLAWHGMHMDWKANQSGCVDNARDGVGWYAP
mmetsp:Transcript_37317/g.112832  ORF Transcript_37317/g.112832 Transcript_37317/m.112832 type:complete len:126 (-) Transcript_37317:111-488(-)